MVIHYFNPGHETAIKNGSPYYMAPSNVSAMQQELAFLPAWYGEIKDAVLVNSADEYYSFLNKTFKDLPKAIYQNDLADDANSEISFWGISLQAIHYAKTLEQKHGIKLTIPQWHKEYEYLNSRQNARDCLSSLIASEKRISEYILPRFYTQLDDINQIVNESSNKLLAKAPYSSSGRGLLWLPTTGLTRTENQILHGILKKQGCISIEEVLDKKTDFAMEFLTDGNGNIEFAGYSLFQTSSKGAYEANYLEKQEYIEQILTNNISHDLLDNIKRILINLLREKYAFFYKGCIGVDMMIYSDENENEYKLHPCVEINTRFNMGYLSLKLFNKYIHPEASGRFMIDFNPVQGRIYEKHLDMQNRYPLLLKEGRIVHGYLSLCPVGTKSRYRAYILIGSSAKQ